MKDFRKYRSDTLRAKWWKYKENGTYFITINCKQRWEKPFGFIQNGEMHLSELGDIAEAIWCLIPDQFPNARIGEFIIMPDHMHGVLFIGDFDEENSGAADKTEDGLLEVGVNTRQDEASIERLSLSVEEEIHKELEAFLGDGVADAPPKRRGGATGEHNPMLHDKHLGRVIRWYKGRSKFEIGKIHKFFRWQPNYWDVIVWDKSRLFYIERYIRNNPKNWKR